MYEKTVKIAATLARVYVVVVWRLFGEAGRSGGGQDGGRDNWRLFEKKQKRSQPDHSLLRPARAVCHTAACRHPHLTAWRWVHVWFLSHTKLKSGHWTLMNSSSQATQEIFLSVSWDPHISCLRACLSLISFGGNATHRVTGE